MKRHKISIIGCGRVGSSIAFLSALKELGDIVIVNRTASRAKGVALDIQEATPLLHSDVDIKGTNNYKETKNSDVVVITAGAQRKADMSRDDLLQLNAAIVKDAVKNIIKYNKEAIIIVVSNPLDAMTQVAKKVSKYPKHRVIGMAGILDSSRFKSFIAKTLKVSVDDVHAMVLGSHGDSMVPLARHSSVKGVPLTELMDKKTLNQLITRTRKAGAEIIQLEKSSAYYSPAASVVSMLEAIIHDKKRVMPCAAYLSGEYGVKGHYMGVPVVLGAKGVEKILSIKLDKDEKKAFLSSAKHVAAMIKKLRV